MQRVLAQTRIVFVEFQFLGRLAATGVVVQVATFLANQHHVFAFFLSHFISLTSPAAHVGREAESLEPREVFRPDRSPKLDSASQKNADARMGTGRDIIR